MTIAWRPQRLFISALFIAMPIACLAAEATFETFKAACIETAAEPDRIEARMKEMPEWKPRSSLGILRGLEDRQQWFLHFDMTLGLVLAGNAPMLDGASLRTCIFTMPIGATSLAEAEEFLKSLGGPLAYPLGKPAPTQQTFVLSLDGNLHYVAVHTIDNDAVLQFMLLDVNDADAAAAIKAAGDDLDAN